MEGLITLLKEHKSCILICSNLVKKRLLKSIDEMINITFKTPKEATNDLLGYYDDIAIYEIKKLLETNYHHALKIFEILLVTNKEEEIKNRLKMYYHKPKEYDRRIIVVGKKDRFLEKALQNKNVIYYECEEKNNILLYEYKSIIEEVEALAHRVSKLLYEGKKDIIIYYNNNEYVDVINDVFPFYNIIYNIDHKQSLYDVLIVRDYLDDKLKLEDIEDEKIRRKIINCYNHLVQIDYTKDDLIDEIKNTTIEKTNFKNAIEIKKYSNFNPFFAYTFIIGKNNNIIPKVYKDDGYYSDEVYKSIGIKTSFEMNLYEKAYFNKTAKQCQNIVISYSKIGLNSTYDDANMDIGLNEDEIKYDYSYKRANLEYMKQYFNYLRVGKKTKSLPSFNSTFKYEKYDSSFKRIDESLIIDALLKDDKMYLSYSRINEYLLCPYKFFAKYVLKLREPLSDASNIGNFFHIVLEKHFQGNKIEECLEFGYKEIELKSIYKKKYDELIKKLIEKINEQKIEYDKMYLEKEFTKEFSNNPKIRLVGKIDKILLNNNIATIIDYKTGKDTIKIEQDINQLIIYLLLVDEYAFGGIFIQHVLPKTLRDTKDENYYLLNGYYNAIYEGDFNGFTKAKEKTNEQINEHKENAIKAIEELKEKVLSGQFQINPEKNACQYCPYAILCYRGMNSGDGEKDEVVK